MTAAPQPESQRVAADIRARIQSGALPPGALLPSEREFIERYGVGKATVAKVISLLRAEGLVESQRGRGTFVRRAVPVIRHGHNRYSRRYREAGIAPFRAEVEAQGRQARVDVAGIDTVATPEWVADLLALNSDISVVRRRNVYRVDDEPVQLVITYIPASIAEGTSLETEVPKPGGIYAALEDLGHTLTRMTEDVTTRMPMPEERETLALDVGTPVLDLVHVSYNADDEPIDVSHFILHGSRNQLTYELPVS